MRRRYAVLVMVFLFLIVGAVAEAKDTLVVVNQMDAKVMDPVAQNDIPSQMACNAIYDGLVYVDDKGDAHPMLAESWEISGDVDYIFHLRKGVRFHNGEELKASDVKFTVDRALSPVGAPVNTIMQHVAGAEVIDDTTVVIRLKYAYYPFLSALYNGVGFVLNQKAVEAAGENYGMNPVGTGPFKFVSWQKGDRYTLERFEDYWGEKAKVKTLVVRSVPEPTSRAIELESGGADIAFPIAQMDIKRIEENPKLKLLRVMTNAVVYMGFNTQKPPFDDVKVRQAVSDALDTEAIHKAVWRGVGQVPRSPVSPQIKYSLDRRYPVHAQNLEKARQLLKEAGVEKLKCQLWTNERKERIDMATIIQEQLSEVGIEVEIKVLEWGAYLEGLGRKEQDLFILGWAAVVDPDFALTAPLQSGMAMNYSFFDNPEFDALLEKGRRTPDGPERAEIYRQAQDLVNDRIPWVYLYNDEAIAGMQKNVQGFAPMASAIHEFRRVYFEE